MPLHSYGVLKATILDRVRATDRTDHYQLFCSDRWRAAINAHSDEPPGDVEYAVLQPFSHAMLAHLARLPAGWHGLRPGDGLDYVRGGFVTPSQFKALPLSKPGPANDLNELFDLHLTRGTQVYVFGEPWGRDSDRGVHDIHQNQGNVPEYRRDDGTWQDGGVLIQRGATGRRSCCASNPSRGTPTTAATPPSSRRRRSVPASAWPGRASASGSRAG